MKTLFSLLSLAAVLSLSSCAGTCPFSKKDCSSCDAGAKKDGGDCCKS